MSKNYKLGITKEFPCNYLPDKQERLLVAVDPLLQNSQQYSWLMTEGFRRSGDQIYRPYCINCNACQSIRVLANEFKPSKSQKRLIKKNEHLTLKVSQHCPPAHYQLYERYINTLHQDGAMYPATQNQFEGFLKSTITHQLNFELWDNDNLVSVAITDVLTDALSAVYTYYDPEYRRNGIGVYSILMQLEQCKVFNKQFLYLGYQIDDCQKMNYKNKYFPYQTLQNNQWNNVKK